jgi:hypothetical protein
MEEKRKNIENEKLLTHPQAIKSTNRFMLIKYLRQGLCKNTLNVSDLLASLNQNYKYFE